MIDSDALLSTIDAVSDDQRTPLATLRRFARARTAGKPVEKCELCSTRLSAEHRHLVDLRTRRLVCCCEACGMLFSGLQSPVYRRVPRTIRALPDFRISDAQWESLLIPINLAFFYRPEGPPRPPAVGQHVLMGGRVGEGQGVPTTDVVFGEGQGGRAAGKVIAVYPSPAGPVESLLGLDAWQAIVADNPQLGDLQAEVEALLANRLSGKHLYYLVPIDEGYRLSGLIRRNWRGLSGGSEVWEEVGQFFERLKERSCLT